MITKQKRQKMEKLVYDTFSALDPSGANTKKYKEFFEGLSDTKFDKFFKELFASDEFLTLDIIDYERTLKMNNIEKAAKVLKIPLFEKLHMPHVSMDKKKVIVTKYTVPVGYINIKRVQQILNKKNGLSTSIDKRSSITGQVTDVDKNGRQSDLENSMLVSLGADKVLRELNGPRADDHVMKREMINSINTKGYVQLEELTDDPANKTTLNTVNVFLLGMGISSDLVTNGLMLKNTIEKEM